MRNFTLLLTAGFAIVLASAASAVHADPPRTPSVTCTGGGLAAPPKFTQVSPGRAEYNFSGVCTTREGRFLGYRIDGTWTPSETAGANANATEVYRVDTLSGPSQSFTAVVGWRCDVDPWLHDVTCARTGDNISDELRALWEEAGQGAWPPSSRGIPRNERAALIAEYDRVNGRFDPARVLSDRVRSDAGSEYGAAAQAATQQAGTVRVVSDEVALNPQPLPPGPPDPDAIQPAQVATPAADNGAKAGIIIVGGKPAYRRINQATTSSDKSKAATP